jgi:hypothetical protein
MTPSSPLTAKSDGSDIVFVSASNQQLAHEIAVANSAVAAAGWIGGASSFSGGAGMTVNSVGVDPMPGDYNTVTSWMNYGLPYGNAPFVFHSPTTATPTVYDLWVEADGCSGFNTGNGDGDVFGSTETGLADQWVYIAAVFYNGVPDAAHNSLYLDGVIQPLSLCDDSTPNSETVADTTIYWGGDPGYQITGLIDEGRVAHVARPSAWIQTEYNNQVAPATFITAGPQQTFP